MRKRFRYNITDSHSGGYRKTEYDSMQFNALDDADFIRQFQEHTGCEHPDTASCPCCGTDFWVHTSNPDSEWADGWTIADCDYMLEANNKDCRH